MIGHLPSGDSPGAQLEYNRDWIKVATCVVCDTTGPHWDNATSKQMVQLCVAPVLWRCTQQDLILHREKPSTITSDKLNIKHLHKVTLTQWHLHCYTRCHWPCIKPSKLSGWHKDHDISWLTWSSYALKVLNAAINNTVTWFGWPETDRPESENYYDFTAANVSQCPRRGATVLSNHSNM